MIKTLIFDFGDVFINLDKAGAMANAIQLFKINEFSEELFKVNNSYEVGTISTEQFIDFYVNRFSNCTKEDIINAWNFIIKDFPEYRLHFLQNLKKQGLYNLILLSNTNAMHINYIKAPVPFHESFKSCFNQFYLSHEIGLRKPNEDIYNFVLGKNHLIAKECLFIDDTQENTDTAKKLGINTWNINEHQEDVIDLFQI